MSTHSSPSPSTIAKPRSERSGFIVSEMWASLAIGLIWLVVLVDALVGPDIVSSNAGSFTRIPSAILLAFFAWLATRVIATHAFGRRDWDSDDRPTGPVD